jgi:stage V sporulation protein R
VVDYAEHHSGTVANHPGRINPYRLGLALLNDIERRWDKGSSAKSGKIAKTCARNAVGIRAR